MKKLMIALSIAFCAPVLTSASVEKECAEVKTLHHVWREEMGDLSRSFDIIPKIEELLVAGAEVNVPDSKNDTIWDKVFSIGCGGHCPNCNWAHGRSAYEDPCALENIWRREVGVRLIKLLTIHGGKPNRWNYQEAYQLYLKDREVVAGKKTLQVQKEATDKQI